MFKETVELIRSLYDGAESIALHEPRFHGNEKRYVNEAIDSTFVSSVGAFVDRFESEFAEYVGSKYAVATVNGTAALHIALLLAGVEKGDEVLTQPLTFVATCNAISYCGAEPVFIDVDRDSLGLSPAGVAEWLQARAVMRDGECYNRESGRRIRACMPMHTFGHPCRTAELRALCDEYGVQVVEDAAESLGSYIGSKHTGTFGTLAAFSFNGNKIITTGGGGMIVTDDERLANRARHLTTTAKEVHPWAFNHDQLGFNYRLPNLNAALGCAQLEQLPQYLAAKRDLAEVYRTFFSGTAFEFVGERRGTRANYWLNAVILADCATRDRFLAYTHEHGVMTRPAWQLMTRLPMYARCQRGRLDNSLWLADRIVNIPSSVRPDGLG